jgi:GT2 family glycosyltransferase
MVVINKIAVLLTCFNRKELTLNCIDMLHKQRIDDGFCIEYYLVDDGCTDGTPLAVKEKFPDVTLIDGNGSLFWNGGMRLAWSEALIKNYDFYLWVNDDSLIYPDAISKLLRAHKQLKENDQNAGAILGSMVDPISKMLSYGGRNKGQGIDPFDMSPILDSRITEYPIECDFINGNFTLIPKATISKIGILSDEFTHSMGDFDYGLRSKIAGLQCWVAPGVLGECKSNPIDGGYLDKRLPFAVRVEKMRNITQLPPANEWMYFVKLHGGRFWYVLWFKAFLRKITPRVWLYLKTRNVN